MCRTQKLERSNLTIDLIDLREKAFNAKAISKVEAAEILNLTNKRQITDLFKVTRALSHRQNGKIVNFYFTGSFFPALSVTGSECALRCKHCQTQLLQKLPAAKTPQKLVEICEKLSQRGAKGVLITGGCQLNGAVPISRFLGAVSEVKKKTGLMVIAHTGILDTKEARELVNAGLDGAAVDVVSSPQTTKSVYGTEFNAEDYGKTLRALETAKMHIVSPHVCVGLNFGKLTHESDSLHLITKIKPTTVVITALMPLKGTPMERVRVAPIDVAKVIIAAILMFPNIPITLGCARSKGPDREQIEKFAIQAGVTNIAIPSESAIQEAESFGLTIAGYGACCAVPPTASFKLKNWRHANT